MVRIRDSHPMLWNVRPRAAVPSAPSRVEPVMVKEEWSREDPAAEPIATPTPTEPKSKSEPREESTQENSRSEAEAKPERRIIQRRIEAPHRRTPDVLGVVHRHVNYLRIRRNDRDRRLTVLGLRGHLLLRGRVQFARSLRFSAQPLHCGYHVGLLSQVRVAESCRPLNIRRQTIQHIGEDYHGLNTRIPILLPCGVDKLLARQIPILLQPLRCFDYFQRIG